MSFEYRPMPHSKTDVKTRVNERELENIERDRKQAEQNVELWSGSLKAALSDLAEIEAEEGQLDPEDPRLYAVKTCFMRLEESRTLLKDLKEEREEIVNRAGSN